MDSQSATFHPSSESWRVQNDLNHVQSVQADHSDRLSRLERKLEDDARMKSVWGGASPFPSVFSATPSHTPLHQPPGHFKNFDDDVSNLIGDLQIDDDDDPPRRMGPSSRANSVRFDDSANQGHWSHASRPSFDFAPRSNASGGLLMNERTSSHRSDGRASSAHSVRSAASGRAGSLTLDNAGFSLGDSARSPVGTPVLAPGLLVLGTVPAIIRCWMNTDFKHDALLYAAVCTGSHRSYIDMSLVQKLDLLDQVETDEHDESKTISLPVYLPEAIPHPSSSSRSAGPVPQLPTLTITFSVMHGGADGPGKTIRVIIGSDTLRLRSADILLSTNSVSLFDDDRNKLSIPLVRPEEERSFNTLQTLTRPDMAIKSTTATLRPRFSIDGLGQRSSYKSSSERLTSPMNMPLQTDKYRAPGVIAKETDSVASRSPQIQAEERSRDLTESRPGSRSGTPYRPTSINTADKMDRQIEDTRSGERSSSTTAMWSSWRREESSNGQAPLQSQAQLQSQSQSQSQPQSQPQPQSYSQMQSQPVLQDQSQAPAQAKSPSTASFDWANKVRDTAQQALKRDTGIKILRPMKTISRTTSTTSGTSLGGISVNASGNIVSVGPQSPAETRSRFFDDGKRRVAGESRNAGQDAVGEVNAPSSGVGAAMYAVGDGHGSVRARANPAGGASAFAWLNPSGGGAK